jgi:hypothetical protein
MGAIVTAPDTYFDDGPKDVVVAFPNQATRIQVTFLANLALMYVTVMFYRIKIQA